MAINILFLVMMLLETRTDMPHELGTVILYLTLAAMWCNRISPFSLLQLDPDKLVSTATFLLGFI